MNKFLLFTILSAFAIQASAQKVSKKPLDHSVYDAWQSVSSEKISDDGKWVLYSITPQEGDANLSIVNLKTNNKTSIARVNSGQFTSDSKFAAFMIKPFFSDVRAAKIKKKKPDDMPKDTLGIVMLGNPAVYKVGRVKSFKLPEDGSGYIAYLMDKAPTDTAKKKSSTVKKDSDFADDEKPSGSESSSEGSDLILRNLLTGVDKTFKYVTDYAISKNGKQLAFISTGSKKDSASVAGAFWYDIEKGILKKISTGKGQYKNLTFDEKGSQLAFLTEKSPAKTLQKLYKLNYFTPAQDSAMVISDQNTIGMPKGWNVSGDSRLNFSKNGEKLYVGTAPIPAPKDTTIVDFEVAKVDIWNYKDDYLQPMQLKNLDRDLKKTYTAVIYPKSSARKIIQLADEKLPDITTADEGDAEYALAATDYGNRIEMQWTGATSRDLYLVSTKTGERKKIASGLRGYPSISPLGNYVAWYDRKDQNYYAYNIKSGKTAQLNTGLSTIFYDEENDVPDDPSPYGVAGWTENDKNVLVYDRYDIWSFDPDGGEAKNMTNGYGRKHNITLHYTSTNDEDRGFRSSNEKPIKIKETSIIDGFDNTTKQNGWFKTTFSSVKDPQLIVMGPYSYNRPVSAKNADVFIYEKGNYENSPDLYVSTDLKKETKLTSTNPQQSQYNWGTAELVHWTTPKGYKSEGILYKPEDFDPTKRYPMVVYFYEKLSNGLFNYQPPAPTPSRLNISFFVSNGYLVFAPDISYENGHPGKSAVEYINSGVESLKQNSWVDGEHIGIQGQSWGGYQVAYLITATNMYAAAWAGAPVVNMTSAYGGIRWESGMNRQFQYEKTQSRIGATLWEKPELYIENSPLFHLPNVQTPVIIMANDADGAVPWYQGIEMFTALRRLNKPVWMLNYNNEAHNLVLRQNRKDISIRELQFFDHFLKGKPAPVWMEKGVPATEKGKKWGFEIQQTDN